MVKGEGKGKKGGRTEKRGEGKGREKERAGQGREKVEQTCSLLL